MKKKTKKLILWGAAGAGLVLLLRGGKSPAKAPSQNGGDLPDASQLKNYVSTGHCCGNCAQGMRCLG